MVVMTVEVMKTL